MVATQTQSTQNNLAPEDARRMLAEGNDRFIRSAPLQRNLADQVAETDKGQYPFAVILSCIDSRVPVELVFDQGIGDVFSVRVAGNIVNEDVLGSMEYACKVAGSKVIVVMGHTKCGAVTAACDNVELGNITPLLTKIKPAMDVVMQEHMDGDLIEKTALQNVRLSIDRIRKESPILSEMESDKKIKIVGAMYSVTTGCVTFL